MHCAALEYCGDLFAIFQVAKHGEPGPRARFFWCHDSEVVKP